MCQMCQITIFNNLAFYRKLYGFTQSELAEAVGVSESSISSYETGEYLPSLFVALKLCYFFDCQMEDLFRLEVEELG